MAPDAERDPEETRPDEAESDVAAPDRVPSQDIPLGETSEVHDDLDPHDLPVDHPSRHAVEHAVEERDGG